jgi:hypothetical protein
MKNALFVILALGLAFGVSGVLSSAYADSDAGKWIARGNFGGLNERVCGGTVGVYERSGSGGGCEYSVELQRFSIAGSDTLEIAPVVGREVLTPPYFVLRNRVARQTYVYRGTCGALLAQIEIVDLSRSPSSEQLQCVATLVPISE